MKDLADILATQITLSGDVQPAFDTRRGIDTAHTVHSRFFLLLDEGISVLIGEEVYTVAFLTQAHEYVRNAYLGADAEKLLNRLEEAESAV